MKIQSDFRVDPDSKIVVHHTFFRVTFAGIEDFTFQISTNYKTNSRLFEITKKGQFHQLSVSPPNIVLIHQTLHVLFNVLSVYQTFHSSQIYVH